MVHIEIDNSFSQIKGLKSNEFRQLRKILSYETDSHAAYFSGWARTNYLIDKKGVFPTGLLKYVLDFTNEMPTNIVDKRKFPKKINNLFNIKLKHKPYAWQKAAVEKALLHGRG